MRLSIVIHHQRLVGILTLLLLSATLQAGLPKGILFGVRGGTSFNGVASQGSGFIGRTMTFGVSYTTQSELGINLQTNFGFQINTYRHFFPNDQLFVEHIQKGFDLDLLAAMKIGERSRFLIGVNVFTPYRAVVDYGQKNFHQTYYFSNDTMINRYHRNALQAGIVVAIEHSLTKQASWWVGLRLQHSAVSPVKEAVMYPDELGNAIVISDRMKAMSVQVSMSFRLGRRQKKNQDAG
jgi:hypothetical protein